MADETEELKQSVAALALRYEDLQHRVTELERVVPPVGAIVPFLGSVDAAEALHTRGYWICDGRVVEDPASPFHQRPTPNLLARVLVGGDEAGTVVEAHASVAIPALSVSTMAKHFGPASHNLPMLGPHVGQAWGHYHRITSEGSTAPATVTTSDVLPAHVTAIYLLRAR